MNDVVTENKEVTPKKSISFYPFSRKPPLIELTEQLERQSLKLNSSWMEP